MQFGFALQSSNVDSLNIYLLDTHLDLLDTDIPSKYFIVSIMSSRRLQCNNFSFLKTSSKMSSRRLQDVFKTSLQDVFKTSWKTQNCYAEDVLKTSSRPTNVCWRDSLNWTKVYPLNKSLDTLDKSLSTR